MQLLHIVAGLCCLATAFADRTGCQIKWCVISELELRKCNDLAQRSPDFTCVRRDSPIGCIHSIKAGEADAITLSGEYIYIAGQMNYNLVPIIAERYSRGACSYSVAVAKKATTFGLNDLRGKKSCHTGLGTSEGWIHPIGTLLNKGLINWEGSDFMPLEQAVSEFFSESCVPGASGKLCQLCRGDCSQTSTNKFFGGAVALECLAEGAGDVAFMNHADIPASGRNNYELLCTDNTRASVESYTTCNLGQEPAHAVVTRKDRELAESIWRSLTTVRGMNLFSSESYGGKNLLFSDSTERLLQIPPGTEPVMYLGLQYTDMLQSLLKAQPRYPTTPFIRWCAVGRAELTKCDIWSYSGLTEEGIAPIECHAGYSVEHCFQKIMRHEADAVAVDGGHVYTAGKCGLVPAMVEQYDEVAASSYYSVAVIKKGSGVTWGNLKGKMSCHTGLGQTSWNIPMVHIHRVTNNCDFSQFFSSGCVPGADPASPFCRNCKGMSVGLDEAECKASVDERYYGHDGAFRCLAEGSGDVAFIKHTTVGENTNGNGPDWAHGLRSDEFELICPGIAGSVPVNDYESCNLAQVPAHAVMTRPDIRSEVVRILNDQQAKFGQQGSEDGFRMFQSSDRRNLLFQDSTKCLQETQTNSYETFLGQDNMIAMNSLRVCTDTTPDMEKSCTFHTCQ